MESELIGSMLNRTVRSVINVSDLAHSLEKVVVDDQLLAHGYVFRVVLEAKAKGEGNIGGHSDLLLELATLEALLGNLVEEGSFGLVLGLGFLFGNLAQLVGGEGTGLLGFQIFSRSGVGEVSLFTSHLPADGARLLVALFFLLFLVRWGLHHDNLADLPSG